MLVRNGTERHRLRSRCPAGDAKTVDDLVTMPFENTESEIPQAGQSWEDLQDRLGDHCVESWSENANQVESGDPLLALSPRPLGWPCEISNFFCDCVAPDDCTGISVWVIFAVAALFMALGFLMGEMAKMMPNSDYDYARARARASTRRRAKLIADARRKWRHLASAAPAA